MACCSRHQNANLSTYNYVRNSIWLCTHYDSIQHSLDTCAPLTCLQNQSVSGQTMLTASSPDENTICSLYMTQVTSFLCHMRSEDKAMEESHTSLAAKAIPAIFFNEALDFWHITQMIPGTSMKAQFSKAFAAKLLADRNFSDNPCQSFCQKCKLYNNSFMSLDTYNRNLKHPNVKIRQITQ